jgi:acyl CoA:acetate/3-ketoacid CoA transferase alpha subunit
VDGKICTANEAVADIKDGAHIAANFWGISGSPGLLMRALVTDAGQLFSLIRAFL